MSYYGDIKPGVNVDMKFTTVNTTGAPAGLAGSPVVSIYKDNSVTQFTAGVTLTTGFDSVVGLNHVRIVTTNTTNYPVAGGSEYQAVITTGTVAGVSVVGYVVGAFSTRNRALGANAITSTVLNTSAITSAKYASAAITATVLNTGAITSAKFASNAITATVLNTGAITSGKFATGAITATVLNTGAITSAKYASGAITATVLNTGAITSAKFASNAITATVLNTGAITAAKFATGAITSTVIQTNAIGAAELAQDAAQEIADEVLNRNIQGGGSGNSRNVANALRALRNKVSISGVTMTVYMEADTTSAWTATVTRAANNPIITVDPA